MWSLGVILFVLLGGYPTYYSCPLSCYLFLPATKLLIITRYAPFEEDTTKKITLFEKIKKGSYTFDHRYWKHISDEAKDIIRNMLIVDPAKRMTAEQALAHPWIAKYQPSPSVSSAPTCASDREASPKKEKEDEKENSKTPKKENEKEKEEKEKPKGKGKGKGKGKAKGKAKAKKEEEEEEEEKEEKEEEKEGDTKATSSPAANDTPSSPTASTTSTPRTPLSARRKRKITPVKENGGSESPTKKTKISNKEKEGEEEEGEGEEEEDTKQKQQPKKKGRKAKKN